MLELLKKNKNLLLLLLLAGYILLLPFLEQSQPGQVVLLLILTSILIAGIFSISYDFRYTALSVLFAIPCLITQWAHFFMDHTLIKTTNMACMIVFIGYTCVALLRHVLSAKRVTLNELYGAISGYILLGIMFAHLYWLIETLLPQAFVFPRKGEQLLMSTYVYFSFVVQSTAGFGDISAVSPYARSFVTLEMIMGVSYLAVLVGRLINAISGLHEPTAQSASSLQREIREDIHAVEDFFLKPFRRRPFGIMLSAIIFNFSTSVLMTRWQVPFFLDSWGTSLAVLLGGFWIGIFTAIFYHLLMAITFWGPSSWFWLLNSIWIGAATWFLDHIGWTRPKHFFKLIAGGIGMGIVNAFVAHGVMKFFHLKPDAGVLPVYNFFMKFVHNRLTASFSEKICVEIADKTVSLLLAAVMAFLICDLLKQHRASSPSKPS